jgi:hypothetical protein
MNADSTGRGQLTNTAGKQPVWSPEGDKIAFTRDGEVYLLMQLTVATKYL